MNREQVRNAIKALGLTGNVISVAIWADRVVWETLEDDPIWGEEYESFESTIEDEQ